MSKVSLGVNISCYLSFFLLIFSGLISVSTAQTVTGPYPIPGGCDCVGNATIASSPNAYYLGPANQLLNSGSTSLVLTGTVACSNPIVAGDKLLIIQMQGATINSSKFDDYGDGVAGIPGNGSLPGSMTAGTFEYVVADNAVGCGGGTLNFTTTPLLNSYENVDYDGTKNRSRYQVLHIPSYCNLTLTANIAVEPWNGEYGGILDIIVKGDLDLGGFTIDATERGFRGGRALEGVWGTGFSILDWGDNATAQGDPASLARFGNSYQMMSTHADGYYWGGKGEGVAGTPRLMYDSRVADAAPNGSGTGYIDTGIEGYVGGSLGRGAPGNAGGGGNNGDRYPGHDSGGGGGGNGGSGGKGGNSWSSQKVIGGDGGEAVVPSGTGGSLIMGGGGGSGLNNNAPMPASDWRGRNYGGNGGGAIKIKAKTITGAGNLVSNGDAGGTWTVQDAGGGGGAGGTIFVIADGGHGLINATAIGGDGGSAVTGGGFDAHGPGGGGAGGTIVSNAALGTNVVTGGVNGLTTPVGTAGPVTNPDGAESGEIGVIVVDPTPVPDLQATVIATCAPDNLTFTLAITVTADVPHNELIITGTGTPFTRVGNLFTSSAILTGTTYSITIDDTTNCLRLDITGTQLCPLTCSVYPFVNAGIDTVLCVGDLYSLNLATAVDSVDNILLTDPIKAGVLWVITGPGTLSSTNIINPILTTTGVGTITLTLVGLSGNIDQALCPNDTMIINITVQDLIVNNQTATVCEDALGSLMATGIDITVFEGAIDPGGNTLAWYSDAGLSILVPTPNSVSISNGDIFYAEVSDGVCTKVATLTYTVTATLNVPNQTPAICESSPGSGTSSIDLTSLDILVGGGNTVVWYSDAGLTTLVATPLNVIVSNGDVFYPLVTSGNCVNSGVVTYTVHSLPIVNNQATIICEDTLGSLMATGIDITVFEAAINPGGNALVWYSDSALTILVPTPNNTVVSNGDVFYAFVDNGNCQDTATLTYTVIPLAESNAGGNDTSCVLTYNLNAIISIGTGIWTGPAGVIFGNANSPTSTVTAPAAGPYTFTWTEINGLGCSSSDSVTIDFSAFDVPGTPTDASCNGDDNGQIILAPQNGFTPYTYQWDAAANNQTTNPAINLGAGTYTVRVTDNFGCFLDSTFTLTEPAPFSYTTSTIPSNCGNPDGSVTVVGFAGGSANYTYDWGSGPVASNTLLNLIPGTYPVTVTDAAIPVGCDTTFTITVLNNPSFAASISAFTDATCSGYTDGTATAAGSDPLVNYTFLWDAAAANQTTQAATGLGAGTYLVTVTDPNTSCTDTVSVTIAEPTLVSVTVNPVNICSGQSATLTAVGADGNGSSYIYSWNPGAFAGNPFVVNPAVTTTYNVVATNNLGCASLPVNVTVTVSLPLAIVAGANSTICIGENATITATATAGSGNGGPYTYNWDNGLGVGQTHIVSPAVTTTYTVTLDDNCTTPLAVAQVTVTVNPLPLVVFDVDTFSLCETPQQAFEFRTDTSGGLFSTILWDFGDGSTGSLDTISHIYTSPGSYDIALTLTSSIATGACSNTLVKPAYVKVFPNPTADFTMNPNPVTMLEPVIYFLDQSYNNIVSWNWEIGGLATSAMQNPIYTFPEDTGKYLIVLTVQDGNGCVNTTSNIAIVLGEYGLYVPNAFTPNADGLNDGFFPNGFGIADKDYVFSIFDRWGEKIFESHTKYEPWYGVYKNKLVPNDVYVWKLTFRDLNGKKRTKIGRVTVVK